MRIKILLYRKRVLHILCMLLLSHSLFSQITVDIKNKQLKEALKEIEVKSSFKFFYNNDLEGLDKIVSLKVSDGNIDVTLNQLLSGSEVSYQKQDNNIILLIPKKTGTSQEGQKKITGVVKDGEGEPVIGASVAVKGMSIGTVTDIDGSFSLDIPQDATLTISYLGLLPKEIKVGDKKVLDISLAENTQALDEVVVVGYGVQKKRDLTGAVSSIKMDDSPTGTLSTVSHALAGKAAGLRVTQATAQPGAGTTFRIRGQTSINASNDPLIIVDGFPITKSASTGSGNRYNAGDQDNTLEMINPADIESIEVLKDASATAIYGSRAGHGVIIITTKRGKAGKPSVTYSGNVSAQTIASNYKILDAPGYMKLSNMYELEKWRRDKGEGAYAAYVTPKPNTPDAYTPKYTEADMANAANTNWVDEVTRTGLQQSHNVSITGGSDKSKYLASLNYFDQKGILKNSNMQRFTINLNNDYEFSQYVKGGLTFNISRNKYDNVPLGTGQFENAGILGVATFFEPNIPVYDKNGNFSESNVYKQFANPVSLLDIDDNTSKDRVLGTGYLSVEPIKGLIIKANLGFDRKSSKRKTYLPKTTLYGKTTNGNANQAQDDGMDYLFNLTANYIKSFGNHSITALVGYEWQQFNAEWFKAGNTNFSIDNFLYNNLGAGSGEKAVGSNKTKSSLSSIFGRINYAFADKYLLTATLRADGSSNFNPDYRWGYFPSVSGAWRFSEEVFMENIRQILSNGKLRAGYGQTGNTSVGNRVQDYFKSDWKYAFGSTGVTGMGVSTLGNPRITWETTSEWNIGVDLGFLDNRINLTVEYYDRVISDLLVTNKKLPSYNEVTTIAANIGSTQSQGIELTLNTVNIKKRDLVWTSDLTFYKYKDRWKERDPNWIPAEYQSVNDPIRAIFNYQADGLLQPGEAVPAWQKGLIPGQIKIKSITQQDALSDGDKILIGSKDPDFSYGFNNTVRYKQFDLNVYLYGEVGRWRDASYYDSWLPYRFSAPSGGLYNMSQKALDSWTLDNPNSSVPNLLMSSTSSGDYFMKNVWFMRCRNITFGYTIPGLKNIASNIRLNVSVNNPFVISNWNGLDPETDYNPSDANVENAAAYSYPNVRTFSLGVDISF
ncbi:MAG: SusC/RagA family TonB-linked outer membrane protein [Tannerellaceae bacterium]|nr:SusC/RagA family TonB-linked outer membrane protein [Tannerellaceae bacterium]